MKSKSLYYSDNDIIALRKLVTLKDNSITLDGSLETKKLIATTEEKQSFWSKKGGGFGILKALLSLSTLGTVFFLGSYFIYKSNNVELNGFLYTGIIFLIALVVICIVFITKKSGGS